MTKPNPDSFPSTASAEERILAAATDEFADKGFFGARTQAIADAAGVNKAMLHYYYRSKEKLYFQVIKTAFGNLLTTLGSVLLTEQPLDRRIERVVDVYLDNFVRNPKLLKIILREGVDGGDRLRQSLVDFKRPETSVNGLTPSTIIARLERETGVDQMSLVHFIMNIVGMCGISFISPIVAGSITDFVLEDMEAFLAQRREAIVAMVAAYLRSQPKLTGATK